MRTRLLSFLKNRIGLDRAIAVSSLTQLMRFVTGPITMVLMIRHFSPEEQGFYYSFGGVLGLQVFLEAGFAQSITQFTSKEFASLRFNSKDFLVGSPAALSRLRSLFSQANRYYRAMAAVLAVCLSFGGYWFFSTKPDHGVPWMLPWFVVCITSSIAFLLTPFWAFLEGCNRVAQVATYRLWSTFGMFLIVATGLMLDFGIYVVVWAAFFNLAFPICYLANPAPGGKTPHFLARRCVGVSVEDRLELDGPLFHRRSNHTPSLCMCGCGTSGKGWHDNPAIAHRSFGRQQLVRNEAATSWITAGPWRVCEIRSSVEIFVKTAHFFRIWHPVTNGLWIDCAHFAFPINR